MCSDRIGGLLFRLGILIKFAWVLSCCCYKKIQHLKQRYLKYYCFIQSPSTKFNWRWFLFQLPCLLLPDCRNKQSQIRWISAGHVWRSCVACGRSLFICATSCSKFCWWMVVICINASVTVTSWSNLLGWSLLRIPGLFRLYYLGNT